MKALINKLKEFHHSNLSQENFSKEFYAALKHPSIAMVFTQLQFSRSRDYIFHPVNLSKFK